jgi:predicted enzyme related to lactoylglutathione lyase
VPCSVDTNQPDPEAAAAFYGGLFGWDFEDAMPPGSAGKYFSVVVGFWLVVTVAAFAAIGPAGSALSQQFNVPGREGFETNKELAAIYGNGGDVAPIVPVVKLPSDRLRPLGSADAPSRRRW